MLYIQDRTGETVAIVSDYYNDMHKMYTQSGTGSYDFTVSRLDEGQEFIIEGNYVVMLDDEGKAHQFTIMKVTETETEKNVECEDASLQLLNKQRRAWTKPATAQPITYYANKALQGTGWEIGYNEVPNLNRTLEWTGSDSSLNRLFSIATQFDNAELDFHVELDRTQVVKRVVDIKKKLGSERDDIQLVYGDTVTGIQKTVSILNFRTALYGVGALVENTKEGEPEKHYDFSSIAYDDGDYFSPKGDPILYARKANERFNLGQEYIDEDYSFDTKDPNELLKHTLTHLKEVSEPEINYEVELADFEGLHLTRGDTVRIIDHGYNPELMITARVIELDKSYTDPSQNKAIFGNFMNLLSGIDPRLLEIQKQISQLPKARTPFPWVRYADDDKGTGMSMFPAGKAYMATVWSYETAVPSDNPIDYAGKWIKVKGEDGQDGSNGIPGPKGADGQTSYFHTAWADDISGSIGFTTSGGNGKKYIGTYSDLIKADSEDHSKYNWALFKGEDGKDGQDGQPGKDGTGIKTTVVRYQASSSGTTHPTGTWTSTVPAVTKGQYLWTRTDWTYTDNSTETGYSVSYIAKDGNNGTNGVAGKDGVGIKTTTITYASSSSGTTAPTSGWTANPPATSAGHYIWTKTVWAYTDGTSETGYSVGKIGEKGDKGETGADGIAGKDGVGVKSTAITYALGDSGTSEPTTGWTTSVPPLIKGKYLWTKTVWLYTDNTSESGYSATYIGKDGNDGNNGLAGKDGVGISATKVEYVGSTSGTTKPTSGWLTTVPSVEAGSFLWTKTTWSYTDGTSESGYSVAKMGEKGDQGIKGPAGADGKSSYTHIAYATSSTGAGFTQTPTATTKYVGMYVDSTATDGTDPSKYKWTLIKGADGSQGTPGKAGTDGKTPYLHTAYSWSADGADRFMTVYPNENLWSDKKAVPSYISAGDGLPHNSVPPDAAMLDPVTVPPTATKLVLTIYNPNKLVNTVKTSKPSFFKGDTYLGYQSSFQLIGDAVQKKEWSIPVGATKAYLGTLLGTANAESFDFSIKTKYEFDTATPYTPSPLDDPEGAYPKFIGTYTDYTAEDSTDPSKYTWAKLRGEQGPKGDSGADGKPGKDGVGIKSTVVTYQLGSSGTTKPTGTWSATVPTLTKGQYLWTKTTWNYSDNTTEDGFSVSYIAKDGNTGANGIAGKDGTGIKTTTITYAGSTSGTTAPTSGWTSTVPTVTAGSYLWTKTVWAYTDNTSETGYSVAMMGVKGDKGDTGSDGKPGKDGVGIKSTVVMYKVDTSGTRKPTTGWQSTIPSVTPGQFLWTRTTWSYTDNTSEVGYSVAKAGETGPKGDPGSKDVPVITSGTSFPTTRKTGDMHWMTNSAGTVIGYYKFNGSQWVVQKIDAQSLNVSSLSALTANLGTINTGTLNGTTINSPNINVPYSHAIIAGDSPWTTKSTGSLTFKDGKIVLQGNIENDSGVPNGQKYYTEVSPSGFTSYITATDGTSIVNKANLVFGQLELFDTNTYGSLSPQSTYSNQIETAQFLGGWYAWNSTGNITVIRDGRIVTISGYPKHNGSDMGQIFQLPDWARPAYSGGVNMTCVTYNSGVGNPKPAKIFIRQSGLATITGGQSGGYAVIGGSFVGADIVK